MFCSLVLLLSCSLFLLYSKQVLYLLQPWGRALVSNSSSTVGAAFLCSFEAALFLFFVFSTSSPCTGAFKTLVKVRGEDHRHFSSVSLNVTPP